MARLLRMPEISANATEAILQEWLVAESTPFVAEDTLATIETDKAAVDIEADSDGVIIKMLVTAGVSVEVGAPIALLGDPQETVADLDALLAELGVAASEPAGTQDASANGAVAADDGAANASAGGDDPVKYSPAPAEVAQRPEIEDRHGREFASPLARRLANDAGLSLSQIPGTGPGGRVRRDDVQAAIASQVDGVTAPAAALPAPVKESLRPEQPVTTAHPVATPAAGYTDVPHSRIRKVVAQRLTESKQAIPHFYLHGAAQVDKLLKLRAKLNASGTAKISVNDMIVKAAARAHTIVPTMNVIWTADAVRQFDSVDISVAIASERGLVTPVLRSVDQLSLGAVAAAVKDFVSRAQSGKLRQNELEGGAFSITNLGMFGVDDFAAIINPPQSAILAVGAAREEPVVRNGKLAVGTVLKFTLSVDHRAVDGALAAEWLRAFTAVLADPVQILL